LRYNAWYASRLKSPKESVSANSTNPPKCLLSRRDLRCCFSENSHYMLKPEKLRVDDEIRTRTWIGPQPIASTIGLQTPYRDSTGNLRVSPIRCTAPSLPKRSQDHRLVYGLPPHSPRRNGEIRTPSPLLPKQVGYHYPTLRYVLHCVVVKIQMASASFLEIRRP
jgi:hypothetical protein